MMTVSLGGSVIEFSEPSRDFPHEKIDLLCRACGMDSMLGNTGADGYGRIISVARTDGDDVGYCCALYIADSADIGALCVREDFRRRHLADVMLGGIIETLAGKGVKDVFLEVRESNAGAIALYAAHGFRAVGKIKNYYCSPAEDAVRMALEI